MSGVVKTMLAIMLVSASLTLHAKSQALLIGIGEYPGDMKLEGPVNDVELIREVLLQSVFFDKKNIVQLLDEKATKKNIIDALNNMVKTTKRGDKVVLYFSGHGTSALDRNNEADIPPKSGALVPFDIDGGDSIEALNERLLIGTRDLRPVLSKLDDAGAEVLVLVDACFSGNVVRGNKSSGLTVKFLDFPKLMQKLLSNKETEAMTTGNAEIPELIETTESYPYKNVFMIAAANEGQVAQDIPSSWVEDFPTVDSKAHGAFTDSLVRVLAGMYDDSSDKNVTSLADLHTATSNLMKDRKFLSRPRLLPEDRSRTEAIALQRFFGESFGFD